MSEWLGLSSDGTCIRGLKSPVADERKGLKLMADERFAEIYNYIELALKLTRPLHI